MNLTEKIKFHCDNKKYCHIYRKVAKKATEYNHGFIVDYSNEFILLQENHDFYIDGYLVFPIRTVSKIQFGSKDKHFDKILHSEGITSVVENKHKINLTNWETVFNSIKDLGFNVIIENEDPEDESLDIGPITEITDKSVYIRYYDANGIIDAESTKIDWNKITIAKFDTQYINLTSKYLKMQKLKIIN